MPILTVVAEHDKDAKCMDEEYDKLEHDHLSA